MKISIFLDKRRSLSDGKFPIKIRMYDKGKTSYVQTEYSASIDEFDEESCLFNIFDKATRLRNMALNADLLKIKDEIEDLHIDLSKKGNRHISPDKLKEVYLKAEFRHSITLNDCFKSFIQTKKGRTAEIYETTLSKIEKYFGNNIYCDDIDTQWLDRFDRFLEKEPILNRDGSVRKEGLEINARSIHFRNIRAVFNYAINNDLIPLNIYPFRKFKIKSEPTIKRSVDVDILRMVLGYNNNPDLFWARDLAIIIFGLIGINVKDLYQIEEFRAKYITYKRAKTGRLYKIMIDDDIKKLLTRHSDNKGLLARKQMALKSFGIKLNKHFKRICEDLNVPPITTYSLRHSWATVAAELDIPKETIGAALGHSDKSVTNIYINFNQKKIDEANTKVLDYIFQRGEYAQKKETD